MFPHNPTTINKRIIIKRRDLLRSRMGNPNSPLDFDIDHFPRVCNSCSPSYEPCSRGSRVLRLARLWVNPNISSFRSKFYNLVISHRLTLIKDAFRHILSLWMSSFIQLSRPIFGRLQRSFSRLLEHQCFVPLSSWSYLEGLMKLENHQ